ncbi:hypothetical protein DAPPUDRAFT_251460 [Daphnia pulex]|uniref:Uncharacterized protein n=1 Tax=Daphnia pulex TaxID=6669 RepID=E9H0H0_DAPPU|nr:hypothetical protein DAPPUDRAFT_251460 [Daphnia pulex]|eukprot:EFX74819.1 hypothetical protein DAPPUDRAFT_251460 [Daphnia pulex]
MKAEMCDAEVGDFYNAAVALTACLGFFDLHSGHFHPSIQLVQKSAALAADLNSEMAEQKCFQTMEVNRGRFLKTYRILPELPKEVDGIPDYRPLEFDTLVADVGNE